MEVFAGGSAGGDQFKVLAGATGIQLAARRDDGTWCETPAGLALPLEGGWNYFVFEFVASSGANDGFFRAWADTGSGMVSYDVAANTSDEPRIGTVSIEGEIFTVVSANQILALALALTGCFVLPTNFSAGPSVTAVSR